MTVQKSYVGETTLKIGHQTLSKTYPKSVTICATFYELLQQAQQAKSKKIQDENDSFKKSDLEWEGLTNRLRAEIDELNNDKEKLLTDNKDLNSQLSENETSKEIKEKVESLDVENKLIKEQLNARETQLTSLQAG